ncbi:hypothetical protein B296_00003768, partial [Ensete ventricosum]
QSPPVLPKLRILLGWFCACHSRNAPSYHSLHPTPRPTVELTTPGGSLVLTGITPPPESQPMATQPPEEHPRLLAEPNHTPLGDALAKEFEANFLASALPKPTTVSLLGMRAIAGAHPSLIIQAFMIGIRPARLFWSLVERPPTTMPKMLQRADQYVATEALVAEMREDQNRHCLLFTILRR